MTPGAKLAAALTAFSWLSCAGCRATGVGADRTGGRTIEMYVVSEDSRFERYRVELDGTLRFGGGREAQLDGYTWSGPLTDDEIGRLFGLVDEHRWLELDPRSAAAPSGRSYTVRLSGSGGRRSFKVLGAPPDAAEIHALLEAAARRRHEPFLQSLPQPGRRE